MSFATVGSPSLRQVPAMSSSLAAATAAAASRDSAKPTSCAGYSADLTWCAASSPHHRPPAFWKTAQARMALAWVSDQRRRRRACAMPQQAIHAWVMALVRRVWPDSGERGRIAADLAPEVPLWWLGPEEVDRLIANALLKRSMRASAPTSRQALLLEQRLPAPMFASGRVAGSNVARSNGCAARFNGSTALYDALRASP
jgi:hypothetical protein